MKRKIIIETCELCPHKESSGGFGSVAYIPNCQKAKKELPWEPQGSRTGRVIAISTNEIPDWCPLELDA